MTKTPFPHQTSGAEYLISNNGGQLFYDMRTGKSFTTLIACHDDPPVLIQGPLTTLLGWISEIKDMGYTKEDIMVVRGNQQQKLNHLRRNDKKFFLLNYDVCERLDVANIRRNSVIRIPDWRWIVFDESYCLANGGYNKPRRQAEKGSARTMYWLNQLPIPEWQKRVALTGLPAPESPLNYASQYLITDGNYFGHTTWESYVKRYWKYNKYVYQWEMKHPHHRIDIMKWVAEHSKCVRMQDVLTNYSGELFTIWDIPLTDDQKRLLAWLDSSTAYRRHHNPNTIKKNLRGMKDADLCREYNRITSTRNTMVHVRELFDMSQCEDVFRVIWEENYQTQLLTPIIKFGFAMQVVCGVHPITKESIHCHKAEYLLQWHNERKLPAVVLSRSRTALDNLSATFTAKGVSHVTVHGGTSDEDRELHRVAFQNGEVDFFLGQTAVVQMGYDLSRTDYIFYISNDYSNNVRSQANKRGTHVMKQTPVTIIDLCADGTRERELVGVLDDKYRSSDEFVNRKTNFFIKE